MLPKYIHQIKYIAFIGLFLTSGLIFSTCKQADNSAKSVKKIPVRIIKASKVDLSFPIRTSGILSSKSEMKLSFKNGGIIEKIYVDEGHTVRKGEVLAKLNLSEIEAHVNQARLGTEKAERDLQRATNLYRDSVATLEELQNAQTALDVAKSSLRIAEFNRKYSVIKAPSKGKILKKLAERNEIIAAGYPLFLFSSKEEDWVLRVALSDINLVMINFNDSALVLFDAFPGMKFKSVVSEIAKASDPYTGTYEVELRLTEPLPNFVSGLIGKAEIIPSHTEEYLVLPMHNIHDADDMTGYVYLVKGNGYEKRKVEILHISDSLVYLGKGIEENDSVITDGADFIEPDMGIEIVD